MPSSDSPSTDDPDSDDDTVRVPAPPSELSDVEQAAWRRGAIAMLRLVGGNAMAMAGAIEQSGQEASAAAEPPGTDDSCPECGGQTIESFDGRVCLSCSWMEDPQ